MDYQRSVAGSFFAPNLERRIARGINTGKNLAIMANQIFAGVRKVKRREIKKTAGEITVLNIPTLRISGVRALFAILFFGFPIYRNNIKLVTPIKHMLRTYTVYGTRN